MREAIPLAACQRTRSAFIHQPLQFGKPVHKVIAYAARQRTPPAFDHNLLSFQNQYKVKPLAA